jgi:ketosteroid isomerase-like protein
MRTLSIAGSVILMLGASAEAQQPSKGCAASPAAAEQQVRKLEAEWTTAFARGDVKFFEQALGEDFMGVGGPGVDSRASMLDDMRRQKAAGQAQAARPFELDTGTMRLRAYGDAVVVTGTATYPPTRPSEKAVHVRYTEVFVCRANRWQAVHGHYSEIPTSTDTAKRGGD